MSAILPDYTGNVVHSMQCLWVTTLGFVTGLFHLMWGFLNSIEITLVPFQRKLRGTHLIEFLFLLFPGVDGTPTFPATRSHSGIHVHHSAGV